MKKTCPHCKEEIEYEKHQQFGAHITNCKDNPRKDEIKEKIKKTRRKNAFQLYKLKCLFCNNEFELEITKNNYEKGKYRKCCSKKCTSKYSMSFLNRNKLKDAKCSKCKIDIKINISASLKTCLCENCGCYKTKKVRKINKIIHNHIKYKKIINNVIVCGLCGEEKCKYPKICRAYLSGRSKIFIKLGFDENKFGSLDFYEEYNRIVELLKNEYKENSLSEIGEKYGLNFQTIYTILKSLGICRRNNSESGILAIMKGRLIFSEANIYPYKSGHHISWEGKTFWYRSSYEKEFCEYLDENKIKYDMENLKIIYWDSQKKCDRTAIPDFYLPNINEIIEIKSTWTYNEQIMKDKFKKYKELGYICKLYLDKKEKMI